MLFLNKSYSRPNSLAGLSSACAPRQLITLTFTKMANYRFAFALRTCFNLLLFNFWCNEVRVIMKSLYKTYSVSEPLFNKAGLNASSASGSIDPLQRLLTAGTINCRLMLLLLLADFNIFHLPGQLNALNSATNHTR